MIMALFNIHSIFTKNIITYHFSTFLNTYFIIGYKFLCSKQISVHVYIASKLYKHTIYCIFM